MLHIKNSTLLAILLLFTLSAQASGFGTQVHSCVSDVLENVRTSEISVACFNTLSRARTWFEGNPVYTGLVVGSLTFAIVTILYKRYIERRTIDFVHAAYKEGFTSGNVYAHRQFDNGMRDQKLAYWQGYDQAMAQQRGINTQSQDVQAADQEQVIEIDLNDLLAILEQGDLDQLGVMVRAGDVDVDITVSVEKID